MTKASSSRSSPQSTPSDMLYKLVAASRSRVLWRSILAGRHQKPIHLQPGLSHRMCHPYGVVQPSTKSSGARRTSGRSQTRRPRLEQRHLRRAKPRRQLVVCMWATEELIEQVGCDNINLTCEGTDVCYVLQSYSDAGMTGNKDLSSAHDCITSKCPTQAAACSSKKPKATATHSMQA